MLQDMKGWDDSLERDQQLEKAKQEQKREENKDLKDRILAALKKKLQQYRTPDRKGRHKAALFSFFVMVALWHQVQRTRIQKRQRQVQDMQNGLKIYTEVTRSFLLKSIKNILLNVKLELNAAARQRARARSECV